MARRLIIDGNGNGATEFTKNSADLVYRRCYWLKMVVIFVAAIINLYRILFHRLWTFKVFLFFFFFFFFCELLNI